jgi:hypothetical protein
MPAMSSSTIQEAAMGRAVPNQHPAVVLRSHYLQLRSLLAVAMIAVVGLTTTVVVLATDDDGTDASPIATRSIDSARGFEGRPDESGVALAISRPPAPVARPDESKVAAAVALSQRHAAARPDESNVASSLSFRRRWPATSDARPDESTVAGAVAGR